MAKKEQKSRLLREDPLSMQHIVDRVKSAQIECTLVNSELHFPPDQSREALLRTVAAYVRTEGFNAAVDTKRGTLTISRRTSGGRRPVVQPMAAPVELREQDVDEGDG